MMQRALIRPSGTFSHGKGHGRRPSTIKRLLPFAFEWEKVPEGRMRALSFRKGGRAWN